MNCAALCKVSFSVSSRNESFIILVFFNNNDDNERYQHGDGL